MTAKWSAQFFCDWSPRWGWTPSVCQHYWHEIVASETQESTCPKCGATRTPWKTTALEGMI